MDLNPNRVRSSPVYRRSLSNTFGSPTTSTDLPEICIRCFSGTVNKMLYVIKDGVRELDQWCNNLLEYGELVSSVKLDDSPKGIQCRKKMRGKVKKRSSRKSVKVLVRV